ncbi:hypothetical protein, partial [Parabacteroides merdae]|uniref:hypothetical protein n=1 Tax=Parabacteroides merdae TaxID=46503 RepID=UPI0018998726
MVRNKCIVYEEVAAGIGTFDGRISSYKLSAWWRTIVVLNESAVRTLGFESSDAALGQRLSV